MSKLRNIMNNHTENSSQNENNVMQSRQTVTQENFSKAYEKLQMDGRKITTRNLRDAIGYGSYGTIQKMLRERNRAVSLAELSESMPQAFMDEILNLGKSLYEYLQQGCVRERIKLQNEHDQMVAEMAEYNETLEQKLNTAQEQQQKLEEENLRLKQEIEAERKLNHELQAQLIKQISDLKSA